MVIWTEGEHKKKVNTYDVIVNTLPIGLSKEQLTGLLACLRPYGRWLHVGAPANDEGELRISAHEMIFKNISIIGSLVGGKWHYEQMLNLVAEKGIRSIVEHYDFEDFPKALDKLENGRPIFRCVVDTEKVHDHFRK